MEIEDVIAEQKKDLQTKLDHVEKNCKIYEVKAKNYQDQGAGHKLYCLSMCEIACSFCQIAYLPTPTSNRKSASFNCFC